MRFGKSLVIAGLAAALGGCAASGPRRVSGRAPSGEYLAADSAPRAKKARPAFGYHYGPSMRSGTAETPPPPAPGASPSRSIRGRYYRPPRTATRLKWRSYRRPYRPYGGPESVKPLPHERPGLATVAGESRYSPVRRVSFVRANPTRPWGMVSIYYNNRTGIAAQIRYRIAWLRCRHCALGWRMVCHRGGYWRRAYCPVVQWQPVRRGVDVWVENASGYMLPGLKVASRSYVIGQRGYRYILVVRNSTYQRLEVVASVDGLDVLDRSPASVRKRGYIIGPRSTLKIQGYRLDASRVAAFRFGSVGRSLAAQTYGDRNVGVIGVAVFNERRVYYNPYHKDIKLRATARPFPLSSYPPVP